MSIVDSLPYNADINLIASVPELDYFYKAFKGSPHILLENQRTARTSNRLQRVIRKNLLVYHSVNHKVFIESIYEHENDESTKKLMLFFQLALTNRLCDELVTDVVLLYYHQGRAGIKKDDLIGYIKEQKIQSDDTDGDWADSTLERIGSKLLTFLKRLDILEGRSKKTFRTIRLTEKQFTFFLYLMTAVYGGDLNILSHPFRKYAFASDEILIDRIKEIAKLGLIDMQYTGDKLVINPTYEYNQVTNAF